MFCSAAIPNSPQLRLFPATVRSKTRQCWETQFADLFSALCSRGNEGVRSARENLNKRLFLEMFPMLFLKRHNA